MRGKKAKALRASARNLATNFSGVDISPNWSRSMNADMKQIAPGLYIPQAKPFITVSIEQGYTREAIYPVCAKAKLFAEFAGTQCLTRQALEQIRALGYDIRVAKAATVAKAGQLWPELRA